MKKKKTIIHRLAWFERRIGRRIFRNQHKCCNHCDNITKNGLIVYDKQHAGYLHLIQCEYASEGILLNYRDKK